MKEAKLWAVMFFSSIICAAILRLDIISAGTLAAQKSLFLQCNICKVVCPDRLDEGPKSLTLLALCGISMDSVTFLSDIGW